MVKSKGKELNGTTLGMNDQFPREINERRKALYPIMKENRIKNKRTYLINYTSKDSYSTTLT